MARTEIDAKLIPQTVDDAADWLRESSRAFRNGPGTLEPGAPGYTDAARKTAAAIVHIEHFNSTRFDADPEYVRKLGWEPKFNKGVASDWAAKGMLHDQNLFGDFSEADRNWLQRGLMAVYDNLDPVARQGLGFDGNRFTQDNSITPRHKLLGKGLVLRAMPLDLSGLTSTDHAAIADMVNRNYTGTPRISADGVSQILARYQPETIEGTAARLEAIFRQRGIPEQLSTPLSKFLPEAALKLAKLRV